MRLTISNAEGAEHSLRITDEAGNLLRGVTEVTIFGDARRMRAIVELNSICIQRLDVAETRVVMRHPGDGAQKDVKRIEFADGTAWEPTP